MSDAPLLNDVLQLQLPHNPEPGSASDEVRARHTRALLVDLVEGAKAADPLVIIIDDCQWLDSASWALLGDAVHRLPGTLFVVATRPITAPGPEELSQIKVGARHMLLDGLSAEATLQMVESDLGVNGLPESVETLIIERAGGHPFFSEEISLSLVDVGVITIDGHNAALGADPADLNRIVPPGTVQNVVTSRIDQLDAGAQFVLRIASVIGRTFDADLLTAVYPIADDREEVTRHLLVLEERGLIRREEGASGEVLAFRHAITRDVAYESILYSQRRHLHRAVAAELEASYEDHRGLEPILAHHWERAAGDGTDDGEALHKAEGYLTESGLGALRHGAFIEARDFLKRALAVQERAPEGNDSLRTLEILKHLGTATFATSGYGASETRAIFERAYAMAEGRVSPSEMFPILWGQWITAHFSSATEEAVRLGERLIEIAEGEDNDEFRLQAHHSLWTTLTLIPDYERARRHIDEGARLWRPEWHERHSAEYGGHDPGSCARRANALALWTTGYPDRAVTEGLAGIRLAQDHHFSRLSAMLAMAFVHRQRGDLDATHAQAETHTAVALEHGFQGFADWGSILSGWVRGRRGDVAAGITAIEQAASSLAYLDPGYMAMLVDLYLLDGRTDMGLDLVDRLFEVVERKNERSYEPELHRLRGELLLQGGGQGSQAAGKLFSRALEIAVSHGATSFSLRAALSLTRLGRSGDSGRRDVMVLSGLVDTFSEGLDTADVVAARVFLAT